MFAKLSTLFFAIRDAADQERTARVASFDDLAEQLAGIEISGAGTPPDAAEVRATLDAAGRSADDLQEAVGRLVEIDRLQRSVEEAAVLDAELRQVQHAEKTELGRFAAQKKKHETVIAELVDRAWKLRAKLDAISGSKAQLERLAGTRPRVPMTPATPETMPLPSVTTGRVLLPGSRKAAAVRELFRWQMANHVPVRCPPDPATIPAQPCLRDVEARIEALEAEARKRGNAEFVRIPPSLLSEREKLRKEIATAEKRWNVWREHERRRREIDAMPAD